MAGVRGAAAVCVATSGAAVPGVRVVGSVLALMLAEGGGLAETGVMAGVCWAGTVCVAASGAAVTTVGVVGAMSGLMSACGGVVGTCGGVVGSVLVGVESLLDLVDETGHVGWLLLCLGSGDIKVGLRWVVFVFEVIGCLACDGGVMKREMCSSSWRGRDYYIVVSVE